MGSMSKEAYFVEAPTCLSCMYSPEGICLNRDSEWFGLDGSVKCSHFCYEPGSDEPIPEDINEILHQARLSTE